MYFVASQNASHTSQDHTWELRCMNHWSSMVADVGVFQVAEVPTNWHECSIPKLFTFGTSFHSHYRIRKLNFWNFFFKTFSFPKYFLFVDIFSAKRESESCGINFTKQIKQLYRTNVLPHVGCSHRRYIVGSRGVDTQLGLYRSCNGGSH